MLLLGDVSLCYCLMMCLCATAGRCVSVLLFGDVSLCYCLVMCLCVTVW